MELKPCPFCGEEAESWYSLDNRDYRISCTSDNCDAIIGKDIAYSAKEAIEAWNKRT